MRIKVIFAAFAALLLVGCGTSPKSPIVKEESSAERLLADIQMCIDKGVILVGHQDDLFYGKNWREWVDGEHSDIKAVAGDYPAVLGIEIGGIELGSEYSIDKIPFELIRRGVAAHYERGGIIAVSWHAANPLSGGDSWDRSMAGAVDSILEGGEQHAKYREWMCRVADFLSSIRDAEGNPVPLIWRPWHENAGDWFWWGSPFCSAESYKRLWAEMYSYFTDERGMDNLVWSFSPSFSAVCPDAYDKYWPGDDMVDLVGADIYQYGSDEQFRQQTSEQLDALVAFADKHHKPAALTEMGYESIPNAKWWSEVLLPAVEGKRIAYLLMWRNAWDREAHYYAPYPGQLSADDFRSFTEREDIATLEEFNALK